MNNNRPAEKKRRPALDLSSLKRAALGLPADLPRRALSHRVVGELLVAVLLGCGLALPVHAGLGLFTSQPALIGLCVATALVLALLHLNRWLLLAGGLLALGGVALWVVRHLSQLSSLPLAVLLLSQGRPVALQLFSAPVAAVIAVTFTTIGFSLARRNTGFYPALALTLVILLGVWFYGNRALLPLCLPALIALCVLYAGASESGASLGRALPMALLVVLLAFFFLPKERLASPQLEATAEKVRQRLEDYLFFTEPRLPYSLQNDGYMPLSANQLGGPATPHDRPVMEVRTSRHVLLRGSIKDTYTGLTWLDSASSGHRYLYINPVYASLRANLFDSDRPSAQARKDSALFAAVPVKVTMAAPGTSTLFMPQRFTALRPGGDMIPYFNVTSELYITRNTIPSDTYAVDAYPLTGDTPGIEALLTAAAQAADPAFESVLQRYQTLPQTVDPEVYRLAADVTAGADTPFAKAQALTRYLQQSFPYTLQQHLPLSSQDFVSWFLLTEKQGYCTSFATALAVMGRGVGLPTRYIEGYTVYPEQGVARITGQEAHAWVEVYFKGFGWLPFDPTPSQHNGGEGDQGGQEPPPMGDSNELDASPEPSPEPTPEPSPESEDSDDNPAGQPTPKPTPEPTPEPEATPTPPPDEPPPADEPPQPPQHWWWLLLLLLLAALAWRIYATHPARVAARQTNPGAKLLVWYRALGLLLAAQGLPAEPNESPLAYFARAEAAGNQRLLPTARLVAASRYGAHALPDGALAGAAQAYASLWKALPPWPKVKAFTQRLLHGLGSLKQIP